MSAVSLSHFLGFGAQWAYKDPDAAISGMEIADMAKRNRRSIDRRGPLQRFLDNQATQDAQSFLDVLTPAQAASGQYASHNGGRRFFRRSQLDRLHSMGKITHEQHQAGNRYRELWDIGRYDHCRTMNLDELRGGNVVAFDMPTRREEAREAWRKARKEIRTRDVMFTDGLLLKNEWPKVGDRARVRRLARVRSVLDTLAVHFRV